MKFRCPVRQVQWNAPQNPLRFTLEFGEIEAALADQACPDVDELSPRIERWRAASLDAARSVVSGGPLPSPEVPPVPIRVSIPEGYAYYALDPTTYIRAANRFWNDHRPDQVLCIGIRSIGTSLSALVAASLEARGVRVQSCTVRPHGHPFDRQIAIGPRLEEVWRTATWCAIVDEGPGLSGSSFASVAAKLSSLGIPDNRIAFFPSWLPDGSHFNSEQARARWQRHAKYHEEFQPQPGWVNFSNGTWLESRKYRDPDGHLLKFEGYYAYGERRFEQGSILANAGFIPPVLHLDNGFLHTEFIAGQPCEPGNRDPELFQTIARYLTFRRHEFTQGAATVCDARMLPRKWIQTSTGYLKTDALDHGDNHFCPGPTDIAYDVAGVIEEFHLNAAEAAEFSAIYARQSGDSSIQHRLPAQSAEYRSLHDD